MPHETDGRNEANGRVALTSLFNAFDLDGNGVLQPSELAVAFGDHAKEFLEFCDQDSDSLISLDEWNDGILTQTKTLTEASFQTDWIERMRSMLPEGWEEKAPAAAEESKATEEAHDTGDNTVSESSAGGLTSADLVTPTDDFLSAADRAFLDWMLCRLNQWGITPANLCRFNAFLLSEVSGEHYTDCRRVLLLHGVLPEGGHAARRRVPTAQGSQDEFSYFATVVNGAHEGAVRGLVQYGSPDTPSSHFMSAGDDGSVKFWGLSTDAVVGAVNLLATAYHNGKPHDR